MDIFLYDKKGTINAKAAYNPETGKVIIKPGSIVTKKLTSAPTFRSRITMQQRRDDAVIDGVVHKEVEFTSLSTAATFVAGSNRNGWNSWKDSNGKTISEILRNNAKKCGNT